MEANILPFLQLLQSYGWSGSVKITEGSIIIPNRRALKTTLKYHEAYQLLKCLAIQIAYLHENGRTLLSIEPAHIADIGDGMYLIETMKHVVKLEGDSVTIGKPNNALLKVPEIKNNPIIPCTTAQSCLYYQIALMFIDILKLDDTMQAIYGTPLYFALKRCLDEEPSRRVLLLV